MPDPTYNPVIGKAIVDRALSWVGLADYKFGACKEGVFDCSGLVAYAVTGEYDHTGWDTSTIATYPCFVTVTDPQPGDIVNKNNAGSQHCGIFLSDHLMVHAPTDDEKVCVGYFNDTYSFRRYIGD